MDWINDFKERCRTEKQIQSLKIDKFHGSLLINFHEGVPVNCDLKKHIQAKSKYDYTGKH